MSLYLGNTKFGSLYLGSTRIAQAYLGSTQIYQYVQPVANNPYMIFEFASSSSRLSVGSSVPSNAVSVTQISASPNRWKLEIYRWYEIYNQPQLGRGIPLLFCANSNQYTGTITSDCTLVEAGNFNAMLDGYYCESMDRAFTGCFGLTALDDVIETPYVTNVGGMFQNCTNIASGQLDQYNWFNTYGTLINNHSGTFTDCGSNTQTGLDELDQIPVGWGGNYVPPASTMTGTSIRVYSRYDAWNLGNSHSDIFSNPYGLSLFTQVSVSNFAGVSMNRSRITPFNGLATGTGNALYFYPCFAQWSSSSPYMISWCYTTTGYNGMLASSQGNTDMPGTLDYSTYGPFNHEFGSYNSSSDVLFIFLVTNKPIDDGYVLSPWEGLSDAYGVLYNGNFRNTDFKYFF